ncbi:hypothetical protein D3C72_97110 [compost metagenome]
MVRATSKILAVGLVALSLMLGCADEEGGIGVSGRKSVSRTPPAESPGGDPDPAPSPTPSAITTQTPKPSPSPTPTPTLAPLPSPVIIASPGEEATPPPDASESLGIED